MVYIFFTDGFEEIEGLTVVDVLRRADVQCQMVGMGKTQITGAHGIRIETDIEISQLDDQAILEAEMIVLPGGPGTESLKTSLSLNRIANEVNDNGKYLAAICAAPTALSAFGLLVGKKFTCYPACIEDIPEGKHLDEKVVRDGQIITSKGVGTALEFALELVSVLKDDDTADQLSHTMVMHY